MEFVAINVMKYLDMPGVLVGFGKNSNSGHSSNNVRSFKKVNKYIVSK